MSVTVVVVAPVSGSTVLEQISFASSCVGGAIVAVVMAVVTVTASEKVAEAGRVLPISRTAMIPTRVRTRRGMLTLGLLSLWSSDGGRVVVRPWRAAGARPAGSAPARRGGRR